MTSTAHPGVTCLDILLTIESLSATRQDTLLTLVDSALVKPLLIFYLRWLKMSFVTCLDTQVTFVGSVLVQLV